MKVRITFDLSTDQVAAVAHYYGSPRADRASVRRFIEADLHATLEGLVTEAEENTFCPRCGELAASEVECPHRCHRLSTLAAKVQACSATGGPSYVVRDYNAGSTAPPLGVPTPELVAASFDAEPTGAVGAYQDEGRWHHAAPGSESLLALQGYMVQTVYVEAS